MKITRHPTKGGPDWWIVAHDLAVVGPTFLRVRPIHIFTYLAQYLPDVNNKKAFAFSYCYALENKLFAVRYQQFELRKAIAEWQDIIYLNKYLREYDDQQKVVCVVEALLNAIYSSLEIVAKINLLINPGLPHSFRDQAKKDTFFSFKKWEWLRLFYDVRSEFEHYATSLPQMSEQAMVFEISRDRKKLALDKGRWKIPLNDVIAFSISLFDMLDQWALSLLPKLDPELDLVSIYQDTPHTPLGHKTIKVKEILALLDGPPKAD
jgi:hypothetical protein